MDILPDPQFWGRLLEISFLNLLLSGDNAVVIALAVRALPRRMRLLGQIWGTIGAVVLRFLFVGIVTALLQIPLLRLIGSLLLLWIAVRLVRPNEEAGSTGRHGTSFWESVWIIIVADITMSLDNVLAVAAAAHGNMPLILIGIGMSIPIVVCGSGLLASLMNRYAWIIWVGGGILGYVAGDMMLEDPIVASCLGRLGPALEYPFPLALAGTLTLLGWRFSVSARRGEPA
jgi:YjbE family integral membrane protein